MKIFGINKNNERKNIHFDSKRVNINAIKQLAKNNPYSLTEPNQRLISNAIDEMSKVKGLKNIKFLMDTAAKVTYSTNIQNDIPAEHDWRAKLANAALQVASITPFVPKEIKEKIANLISGHKELTEIEKEIVKQKNQLLATVDLEQIKNETIGPIKEFKKNLNYFIVSSETTLEHKKYVLERLNYFMSNDYEINPQLKDKKSVVAAEIINDMTIAVPGNEIPNIKAVDQKFHGMCGMISIVRKKLVYEDKPKFVDTVLSELDNTPYISVYDRSHLGSGKKVKVSKVPVDFEIALNLGYRIIDASTLHWMQISSMVGANNYAYEEYHPFDKETFGVRTDRFFNTKIANENLQVKQVYYQALGKAKSVLEDYIATNIRKKVNRKEGYENRTANLNLQSKSLKQLEKTLISLSEDVTDKNVRIIIDKLLKLEQKSSKKIKKEDEFSYIPNEEFKQKKEKIKGFLAQYIKKTISDENFEKLYESLSFFKSLSESGSSSGSAITKYIKAENLYEIAASFRHQIARGLEVEENVDIQILEEGLPTKETMLTNTIDKLIENLERNSQYSDKIIEQLSNNFGLENNKTSVIAGLKDLKKSIETILTEEINDIYASMTLKTKKDALYRNIQSNLDQILNKDSYTTKIVASLLGVKPSQQKLAKILQKDLELLGNSDSPKIYEELLLKYGNASEITLLKELFTNMLNQMAIGIQEEFVEEFSAVNNIDIDKNPNAFGEKLEELKERISILDASIKEISKNLKVIDSDGDILFSADPKDIILKEMEYSYRIPDYKAMKELQAHKDKVDKNWAKNEFGLRKEIRKDKTLFELSKREIATTKLIENNIKNMYKYVQKEIAQVKKDIKEPLEELHQIIGVNTGEFWVYDNNSGVGTNKMIRAIEYLTGRPHYSIKNYKKAVKKIKNSPYSGITSSFTRHNKGGMHAQYIADIEPIKVKIKDENGNEKIVEKDVLFHDNTWGVRERENIWIDSQGLTRTDYKDFQGGTLGYITNTSYRNGNFVDRISDEMLLELEPSYVNSKAYNKIRPYTGEKYIRQQYDDVIIDGKSPELKVLAADIHDTIFSQNSKYLKKLGKIASKLNEADIQAEITKLEGYDRSWVDTYKKLKTRIYGDIITKAITTKEEYDNLPDDDELKVALEKTALSEAFSTAGMTAEIVETKNVRDLEKFKALQKRRAINSFKYSFAKSLNTVEYLSKEFDDEKAKGIDDILEKHNIKLSDKEADLLFPNFTVDTRYFNGSAKRTIALVMKDLSKNINKVIKDENIAEEIKDYYRKFFTETLYFNLNNLENKDELNIGRLINFIDRIYEPESDEEFVKIYRKLQNMTTEEFKKEVLPKTTNKDMGIKEVSGFDILKKLQFHDEDIINSFKNTVILDSLGNDLNLKKYSPEYVHKQLTRFAKFKEDNDFKHYYHSINNTLSTLTYEKIFNRYKDSGISKGIFPAYPKTDIMNEELIGTSFNNAVELIESNVFKIKGIKEQIENYEISHKLNKYILKFSPNDIPTDYQYRKINSLLGRLITLNANDPSVSNVLDLAEQCLEFEKGTSWKNYYPIVSEIVKAFFNFEATTSKEQLLNMIENLKKEIQEHQKAFSVSLVQKKYQNAIVEDMNNLKQAFIKNKTDDIEALKEKFYNNFVKGHILQNPTELLDSYLKSLTMDSTLKDYSIAYKALLDRGIAYAKLAEIQELLMNAISEGTAINIKSAFDNYKILLNIGEYKMSSDEAIFVMVNTLVLENDTDTATYFMDKLGIGEQYVRYVIKNTNIGDMKDIVDKAYKLSGNFSSFKKSLEPEIENITNLLEENTEDYSIILERFKKQIRKQAKKHGIDKNSTSTLLEAVDNMLEAHNSKPESKQLFIFSTVLNSAFNVLSQTVSNTIAGLNSILDSNNKIVNLANSIPLPVSSDLCKQREEFNQKYEELSNYSQTLSLQAEENSDRI